MVGGNTWSPSGTVSVTAVDGATGADLPAVIASPSSVVCVGLFTALFRSTAGLAISSSAWTQDGTTTVNATNGATGSLLSSPLLSFAFAFCFILYRGRMGPINLGGTGVHFSGFGLLSTWSQLANLVVTASDGQATGNATRVVRLATALAHMYGIPIMHQEF